MLQLRRLGLLQPPKPLPLQRLLLFGLLLGLTLPRLRWNPHR